MPRKLMYVPVEPSVLQWLRSSSGWTHADVSRKLGVQEETYIKIESGEKKPTLRQIEILAKAFHRPVTAFLLPSPAKEPDLPKDFRLIPARERKFSKKLRRVFRRARWLQNASGELMRNLSFNIEPNIRKHNPSDDPADVARQERIESGINLDTQIKWKNSYEAFRKWRSYLELKNIRVFQMGMPSDEARGFSLTDKKPYVIVVNSADDINARIFTLFHEYAHILLSETSVCIPEFGPAKITTEEASIERWCNRFAAEFILPADTQQELTRDLSKPGKADFGKALNRYSNRFKISKYALLVRLKEFGLVSDGDIARFTGRIRETEKKKTGFGRGLTQIERCRAEKGDNYVSLVLENLDRGLINTRDALGYLSIRMRYLDPLRKKEGAKND